MHPSNSRVYTIKYQDKDQVFRGYRKYDMSMCADLDYGTMSYPSGQAQFGIFSEKAKPHLICMENIGGTFTYNLYNWGEKKSASTEAEFWNQMNKYREGYNKIIMMTLD